MVKQNYSLFPGSKNTMMMVSFAGLNCTPDRRDPVLFPILTDSLARSSTKHLRDELSMSYYRRPSGVVPLQAKADLEEQMDAVDVAQKGKGKMKEVTNSVGAPKGTKTVAKFKVLEDCGVRAWIVLSADSHSLSRGAGFSYS